MYESHFNLSDRPFAQTPNESRYFPSVQGEQARQSLTSCIERAAGPGLLLGAAGVGKTLLCRVIARQFRERFDVVVLTGARLGTRRSLLQCVLFELKVRYHDLDDGELWLTLMEHLEPRESGKDGLLLVVDEAHLLSVPMLEELRLMTNFVRGGESRIRLLLSGGNELDERLADPGLESFSQRIASRRYLEPLDYEESTFYVRSQFAASGVDAESIIDGEGIRAVYHASGGVPRLINQVCDHALALAARDGLRRIDKRMIEAAWADLQRFPMPAAYATESPHSSESAVVEFGELDGHFDSDGDAFDTRSPEFGPERSFASPSEEGPVADDAFAELDEMIEEQGPGDDGYSPMISIDRADGTVSADDELSHNDATPTAAEVGFPFPDGRPDDGDLDIDRQLDRLRDCLSEVDDVALAAQEDDSRRMVPLVIDEDPTGGTGPRGDWSAGDNPFAEPFASEEVVLDRYASFEPPPHHRAPRAEHSSPHPFAEWMGENPYRDETPRGESRTNSPMEEEEQDDDDDDSLEARRDGLLASPIGAVGQGRRDVGDLWSDQRSFDYGVGEMDDADDGIMRILLDPASDPVYPVEGPAAVDDSGGGEDGWTAPRMVRMPPVDEENLLQLRVAPTDDRDIIIIDDRAAAEANAGSDTRDESADSQYRQILSQMRDSWPQE